MLAVFVNCGAVILGSILGILFAKKFTQELSDMIQTACGVVSSIIGLQMAFKYGSIIFLALSLIIGGVIGYALDIDGAVLKLGEKLEVLTKRKEKTVLPEKAEASAEVTESTKVPESTESTKATESSKSTKTNVPAHSNFAYAFLNSSVLFCVGAMAIVGSFEAGVNHNYTTIFTKSILDGFMAIGFTAAMGIGTAFSALAILIYQGALTFLSIWLKPFVSEMLIQELSACGGAIIVMIGINLLGLKKIKTANFLPALVIEILFVIFVPMIKGLFV